ncbi:MAG TPA: PQQ-binding-like beta-propeller repeat protein [Lacipirellulaceae bacterium]|nr:PQQ-binding-like beta-propeller repeat protein [Lacipirellulaceae bacterium]
MRTRVASIVVIVASWLAPPARADWPQFRGPFGNGQANENASDQSLGLPTTWSESQNVRWKTPIHDRGWSSPVILGGQIWMTTATEDGHDFYAICVDEVTGKILYDLKLFHADSPEPLGNNTNSYATPTADIEPGRVYLHFGSYGTACLDTATGKVLWQRDDLPCRHYRGPSSSPVLFENLLILTFDGVDQQYVTALDKATGKTVWRTDRKVAWNDQDVTGKGEAEAKRLLDGDHRKAHSTPLVIKTPTGQWQLVSGGAKAAFGYDPRTGNELWRIEFDDFSVAPRPIYHDGIVYLVTGNTHPELWAIRPDATGNLTETPNILWRLKSRVAHTASPMFVDGLIYMASDEGIINCIDAANGNTAWQKRVGGSFAASPIYADGLLYFCDRDGQSTVIKPGRVFEQVASNSLDDGLMASPAIDGRALYLRTKTHLYRIENPEPAAR